MLGLATGEAMAHLRRLEVEGRAVRAVRDGVHWYRAVPDRSRMRSGAPPRYRHPRPWEQDYPPLSLLEMFEAHARSAPRTRWLIDFIGRKYSYAETLHGVDRVACGLAELGIAKGDRVGLFLPNMPHYVAAYYGALKAGAVGGQFLAALHGRRAERAGRGQRHAASCSRSRRRRYSRPLSKC